MRKLHVISLSLLSAVAAWACSSGSDDSTSQGGSAISAGSDDEKSPSPGPSSSTGAAATPAPSSSTNPSDPSSAADACQAACDQKHPAGVKAEMADDDTFTKCFCGASACGTACGSTMLCTDNGAEPAEGDACSACLDGPAAGVCDGQSGTACQAEPDCKALEDCYDACAPNGDDDDAGAY